MQQYAHQRILYLSYPSSPWLHASLRSQWTEILPKVPLGPSSRHLFKIPDTTRFNYVKLNMYPDGGIVSTATVGLSR